MSDQLKEMMMDKIRLTPSQARLLNSIRHYTDRGAQFNKCYQGGNEKTYLALEGKGLIHSKKPFAANYHTVTITEKGRAVCKGDLT